MIRHLSARIGLLLGVAIVATGCLGVTEPEPTLFWEAEFDVLDEDGAPYLTGSIAMVAGQFHTDIGIGIQEVAAEPMIEALGWRVRSGPCDGEGQPVVSQVNFPTLTFNEQGESGATASIGRRIIGDITYVGELFAEPDGTGEVLMCTLMVPTD